jgi:aspartate ammonia-lyase
VNNSIALVTALGPALGYEVSSRVARRALNENRRVRDIVLEEGLLKEDELDELLRVEAMTRPSRSMTAHSVRNA